MRKVLFVDNDATLRVIVKNSLESYWEAKVMLAASGMEALRIANREPIELIILDVIMPGMDGVQTLKKLREQGTKAPVIFVTAKDDIEDLEAMKSMGVEAIIRKPFQPPVLLEECQRIFKPQAK